MLRVTQHGRVGKRLGEREKEKGVIRRLVPHVPVAVPSFLLKDQWKKQGQRSQEPRAFYLEHILASEFETMASPLWFNALNYIKMTWIRRFLNSLPELSF